MKGIHPPIGPPAGERRMYRSLLLPLDGSSFANEALPLAGLLARTLGARLTLVHVIRPAPDFDFKTPEADLEWRNQVRTAASAALGDLSVDLRREGVEALAEIREGRVVDTLLAAAGEAQADLAVLSSHGAGGFRRWWLGSVADGLLRSGAFPVLLVRPWDDTRERPSEGPRFQTILVPLDGTEASEIALAHAQEFQRVFGAKIILVQVVPTALDVGTLYGIPSVPLDTDAPRRQGEAARDYLDGVSARLEAGDSGPVEVRVVEASGAAEGILNASRDFHADLIVIATEARGGLKRTLLGSVADKVIRGAAPPVLAVPAP
jgi:nucleotide-binding universal stress UspA family protein